MNNNKHGMNIKSKMKESCRKTIVSLKRKPQMIPMLVLAVAFLYYSLNLTNISNTTAKIQLSGMGLSGFCTMLFLINIVNREFWSVGFFFFFFLVMSSLDVASG